MTIEKLLENTQPLTEIAKINEIIDEVNTGITITVDEEMSSSSENPVQNKVITSALQGKQDSLTAGDNIDITNGTISATDTTYSAGDNITISNGTISATDTTYSAGDNITISNGTISATNTEYTAGDGITIDFNHVISSDNYSYSATNADTLTPINGIVTWNVTHNLDTQNVVVSLYYNSVEIKKDVTIISDNAINVQFPATSDIPAEILKVIVVANGASSGTPTPVVDSNFIPKNTVITVTSDGSGDYTTLSDAIAYLSGKYSNGQITIQMNTGTYNSTDISLSEGYCNIPMLLIKGEGTANTILNFTSTVGVCFFVSNMIVQFENMAINRPNINTSTVGEDTLRASYNGFIHVRNCSFTNHSSALSAYLEGKTYLSGTNSFNNCRSAIWAGLGGVTTNAWSATINLSNCYYGFEVSNGGQIHKNGGTTINYTSVLHKTSQSSGGASSTGWITNIS